MSNPIVFYATPATIFLIAAFMLLIWLLLRGLNKSGKLFTTVYEWEHGLLYENGSFARQLPAGRYLSKSLFSQRDVVTLRRTDQIYRSEMIDVSSQDKLVFRLAAQITYRIEDARTAFENDHTDQIGTAIRTALVKLASTRTLESIVSDRAATDAALLSEIPSPVAGCAITSVLIHALTLPPELRRLFVEIERAKLEGQAALERARGEHAALRSLANAAGLLKDNPDLMNLRLLQSAASASGRGQLTLIVGQDGINLGRANAGQSLK